MAIKKRCIGCGAPFDFSGGSVYVCKYCGTEQNPSISAGEQDLFLNAETLRRNGDFGKAKSEYLRLIRMNGNLAEAYFGAFLADFKISEEEKVAEEGYCLCLSARSVFEDENYCEALKKGGSSVEKWKALAEIIERSRKENLSVAEKIKRNNYHLLILCDDNSERALSIANGLYDFLKDRVNAFFAPRSIEVASKTKAENIVLSACKTINLCFAVFDGYTDNERFKNQCAVFLQNHKSFMFYAITDDSGDIPTEISYGKAIEPSETLSEEVLCETRIMGVFSLEEQNELRENGRLTLINGESPVISEYE
ncbi:MAG: hypothetical protein IJS67_03120 [Clostridia bacterium]|nr:hypothetical protein [Clostridia bacterium]